MTAPSQPQPRHRSQSRSRASSHRREGRSAGDGHGNLNGHRHSSRKNDSRQQHHQHGGDRSTTSSKSASIVDMSSIKPFLLSDDRGDPDAPPPASTSTMARGRSLSRIRSRSKAPLPSSSSTDRQHAHENIKSMKAIVQQLGERLPHPGKNGNKPPPKSHHAAMMAAQVLKEMNGSHRDHRDDRMRSRSKSRGPAPSVRPASRSRPRSRSRSVATSRMHNDRGNDPPRPRSRSRSRPRRPSVGIAHRGLGGGNVRGSRAADDRDLHRGDSRSFHSSSASGSFFSESQSSYSTGSSSRRLRRRQPQPNQQPKRQQQRQPQKQPPQPRETRNEEPPLPRQGRRGPSPSHGHRPSSRSRSQSRPRPVPQRSASARFLALPPSTTSPIPSSLSSSLCSPVHANVSRNNSHRVVHVDKHGCCKFHPFVQLHERKPNSSSNGGGGGGWRVLSRSCHLCEREEAEELVSGILAEGVGNGERKKSKESSPSLQEETKSDIATARHDRVRRDGRRPPPQLTKSCPPQHSLPHKKQPPQRQQGHRVRDDDAGCDNSNSRALVLRERTPSPERSLDSKRTGRSGSRRGGRNHTKICVSSRSSSRSASRSPSPPPPPPFPTHRGSFLRRGRQEDECSITPSLLESEQENEDYSSSEEESESCTSDECSQSASEESESFYSNDDEELADDDVDDSGGVPSEHSDNLVRPIRKAISATSQAENSFGEPLSLPPPGKSKAASANATAKNKNNTATRDPFVDAMIEKLRANADSLIGELKVPPKLIEIPVDISSASGDASSVHSNSSNSKSTMGKSSLRTSDQQDVKSVKSYKSEGVKSSRSKSKSKGNNIPKSSSSGNIPGKPNVDMSKVELALQKIKALDAAAAQHATSSSAKSPKAAKPVAMPPPPKSVQHRPPPPKASSKTGASNGNNANGQTSKTPPPPPPSGATGNGMTVSRPPPPPPPPRRPAKSSEAAKSDSGDDENETSMMVLNPEPEPELEGDEPQLLPPATMYPPYNACDVPSNHFPSNSNNQFPTSNANNQYPHNNTMIAGNFFENQDLEPVAEEPKKDDWKKYLTGVIKREIAEGRTEKKSKLNGRVPSKFADRELIRNVKQMPFTDQFGDFGYYSGQVNEEGRPDGKGSMKYENGVFYEGSWTNGCQDQKAASQYTRIRGGFTSWQGKGTKATKSGMVLPWNARKNDQVNNSSKTNVRGMEWTDLNGDSGRYSGEVNADQLPHGCGIMKYDFGLIVEGEWTNGVLKENPHDRMVGMAAATMGGGAASVAGAARSIAPGMSVGPGVPGFAGGASVIGGGMSVGPGSVFGATMPIYGPPVQPIQYGMNPMMMANQPRPASQHAMIAQQTAMMRTMGGNMYGSGASAYGGGSVYGGNQFPQSMPMQAAPQTSSAPTGKPPISEIKIN